jgi:hypothetical protein
MAACGMGVLRGWWKSSGESRKVARNTACPGAEILFGGQSQRPTADLAGVGVVLRSLQDKTLCVRRIVVGSGAEAAGIMPGDCILEVDGAGMTGQGLGAATKAFLGPIGSVARIKAMRMVDNKREMKEFMVVRELKATAEPEYKLQGGGENKCTTQHLHLECLQQTNQSGQRKEAQDNKSVNNSGEIRKKMDIQIGAEEMREAEALNNTDDNIPRTEEENLAVDSVLLGSELKLKKNGEETWHSVRARINAEGKLTCTGMSYGKSMEILAARCMWAGPVLSVYTPKMSAKMFDEMDRKLFVMLEENSDVVVYSTGGAVSAVQSTTIELLAASEAQRDLWIKGICVLGSGNGCNLSNTVHKHSPCTQNTVLVLKRGSLAPPSRHSTSSSPTSNNDALTVPAAAAQVCMAANTQEAPSETTSAPLDLTPFHPPSLPFHPPSLSQHGAQPAEIWTDTRMEKARTSVETSTPIHLETEMTEDTVQAGQVDVAAPKDEEEVAEEDEMERLTGLALSRIACFEATARQKDKYSAANLEKQWQITSNKWAETAHTEEQSTRDDCPAASHSHVGMHGAARTAASTSLTSTSTCCVSDCVKESRPAKKSLSSVRGSGGDLASLMEARRKAQEENADDGYYF